MNRGLLGPVVAAASAALLSVLLVRAAPPLGQGALGVPLSTGFTYQGQLLRSGLPYSGACDFEFRLFASETGGDQLGASIIRPALSVTNGLFTTVLDFGPNAFAGQARFIEVAIKCAGDAAMSTLSPRTALTPAPYALYAVSAGTAMSATSSFSATTAVTATTAFSATTAGSAIVATSATTALSATHALTATQSLTAYHALSSSLAITASTAPYAGLTGVPTPLAALSSPSPCSSGQVPKWLGTTWSCQNDSDTTYTAGPGIRLSGNEFSVAAAPRPTTTRSTLDGQSTDAGEWPSIAIGVDGLALIAYYDRTNGDLKVAHCEDVACTTATITTIDGTSSNVGQFTSLTIGPDGFGIMSYYDVTNTALKVAHCDNIRCTSATTATLDDTGIVGQYTSISVMKDEIENGNGQVVIAYYDASANRPKLIQCRNTQCTSFVPLVENAAIDGVGIGQWTATVTFPGTGLPFVFSRKTSSPAGIRYFACQSATECATGGLAGDIDSSGTSFSELAATILANGRPLLVARNESLNRLDIFRCANDACSTADTFSGPTGGRMPAITVLPTGQAFVFYVHPPTSQLRGLFCTDLLCSTRLTIEDIGRVHPSSTQWHTAVATGSDGNPLFVFWDDGNTALQVVHATNPFGTPGYRRR
ncbi:MAG: hypothetical protein KatS3mg060_2907 [Dehalococcoidia bacterium]|nr:MAG: hypothetical protein KatS3mg060_2907 [Dehalococcoidia bacterium]